MNALEVDDPAVTSSGHRTKSLILSVTSSTDPAVRALYDATYDFIREN